MQQYRQEDVVRTRLNEYCSGTPFTEVYEAGPNIYQLDVRTDVQYASLKDLFEDSYNSDSTIELTDGLTLNVIHIGYAPDTIRYVGVRVENKTTEYL